jgi:hypothetical protein
MEKAVFFGKKLHLHRLVVYLNVILSLLYIVGWRYHWLHRLNSLVLLVSLGDLLKYGVMLRAQSIPNAPPAIRSLYYVAAMLFPLTLIDLLFAVNPGRALFGLSEPDATLLLELYYFNLNLVAFCINLWFIMPALNGRLGKAKYLLVMLLNACLYVLFFR